MVRLFSAGDFNGDINGDNNGDNNGDINGDNNGDINGGNNGDINGDIKDFDQISIQNQNCSMSSFILFILKL